MRIMGLDVGKKTIGVAVSDEGALTAQPLLTIKRTSKAKDFAELQRIIREFAIETIVAGLPVNMDGTLGPQSQVMLKFIDDLKAETGLPVIAWDERLSTIAVTRVLLEGDISRAKRKEVVDKMAASYILQGYLDSRRIADSSQGGTR
ncbi:MAG: Holliday junction resolvase RuvX [Deltaproteobacteria bacterium]|nr:Holliday junction resolvase RuvX [Deltaproteobacteria bacterium]